MVTITGRGWRAEPERHRLSALGYKTGRRGHEKTSFMMHTVFPLMPMHFEISPYSKELLHRRSEEEYALNALKQRGWKIHIISGAMGTGAYEAFKGNSYLQFAPTHWGKVVIERVSIVDPNEVPALQKIFRKPYPYKLDSAKPSVEDDINEILYEPKRDAVDSEVVTIDVPRSKKKDFEFLKAYTEYPTVGKWKQYKDKNLQIEVQFKDAKDEKYGKRLMSLLRKFNKEKLKEEQIYARTSPVEETTM